MNTTELKQIGNLLYEAKHWERLEWDEKGNRKSDSTYKEYHLHPFGPIPPTYIVTPMPKHDDLERAFQTRQYRIR